MYKFLYLSHILNTNVPTYGDEDRIEIKPQTEISNGETVNMFTLHLTNNHIGTYIDLPKHFFNCERGVKFYDPNIWYFQNVKLVDIPRSDSKLIFSEDLPDNIAADVDLLLIRTGYEEYRIEDKYWNDNPGLSSEMANFLRIKYPKLRAVGFDFISLTSWKHKDEGLKAHLNFLDPSQREIFIIEDMKLSELSDHKIVDLTAAPWLIDEIDSAPVTVIARVE